MKNDIFVLKGKVIFPYLNKLDKNGRNSFTLLIEKDEKEKLVSYFRYIAKRDRGLEDAYDLLTHKRVVSVDEMVSKLKVKKKLRLIEEGKPEEASNDTWYDDWVGKYKIIFKKSIDPRYHWKCIGVDNNLILDSDVRFGAEVSVVFDSSIKKLEKHGDALFTNARIIKILKDVEYTSQPKFSEDDYLSALGLSSDDITENGSVADEYMVHVDSDVSDKFNEVKVSDNDLDPLFG